jgi:hypothetical protein
MRRRERLELYEAEGITVSAVKTVLMRNRPDLDELALRTTLAEPKVARIVAEVDSDPGFPRVWKLFAFALPREIRTRVFEPAHQELLEDYIIAQGLYQAKWPRRWLILCFSIRTILMVLDSLRAMLGAKLLKLAIWTARCSAERLFEAFSGSSCIWVGSHPDPRNTSPRGGAVQLT